MPSFEIPDGPTTVKLSGSLTDAKAPRTGSVVFAVNNKAGDTRSGRLSIQVAGQTKAEWFAIDGEQERKFDPSPASQTVTVKLSVPGEVAAGNYPFRLRVVAVNDPDNDFADGPATTAEVAARVPPPPPKIWLWIVLAVVLLAVIGGVLWFVLKHKSDGPTDIGATPATSETASAPTPTPSPTASVPTTATVPNLVGKTLAEAGPLAGDFDLTPVAGQAAGKAPDTILQQAPAADSVQNKGIPLKVTFDPGVIVPPLNGQNPEQAINTLNRAGLHVQSSTTRCVESGTAGLIVDSQPKPNDRVASGSGVVVFVAVIDGMIGRTRFACGRRFEMQKIEMRNTIPFRVNP